MPKPSATRETAQSIKHGRRTFKVGSTYPYKSRANEGRGRVQTIYKIATGWLVTLFDAERNKAVTVRPSQVGQS